MMKSRHIQGIQTGQMISLCNTVGHDHLLDDRQHGPEFGSRNGCRIDFLAPLQFPENLDFSCSAPAPFAFTAPTEVTFIDFNFSRIGIGFRQIRGNDRSQPILKRNIGILIDANQLAHPSALVAATKYFTNRFRSFAVNRL